MTISIKTGKRFVIVSLLLLTLTGCTVETLPTENTENTETTDILPVQLENTLEEKTLYTSMAEMAPLETVTAQFIAALGSNNDTIKDRITTRWIDHVKYRIPEFSQNFYNNTGEGENDLYSIYDTYFMNGWDSSKIADIENPVQRAYFETLDNSFMKIVSYEEYLGPGFDYKKLADLPELSEGFRNYFELSDAYYQFLEESSTTGQLPYTSFADYIIKVETIRMASDSKALNSQLDPLLRWSYGVFFLGTMGSGPLDYETQKFNPEFIERLNVIIKEYPSSALAELCTSVLRLSEEPQMMIYYLNDQVQYFRRFGLDSTKGIRTLYDFKNETLFEAKPELYGFDNLETMTTLNGKLNKIMDDLKAEIEWGNSETASYNLSYYLEFANDHWASFQIAASSFETTTNQNVNLNRSVILDLNTGQLATLADILGNQAEEGTALIQSLIFEQASVYQKIDFQKQIVFSDKLSLGEDYLLVMLDPGTVSDDQAYPLFIDVRYGKLFPALDFRTLLMP